MFKILLVFFTTVAAVYCSSNQDECLDIKKKVGFNYHYSGTKSVTISGEKCQRWADDNSPHEVVALLYNTEKRKELGNYCREFNSTEADKPWCYTKNPKIRWEICDIPFCTHQDECLDPRTKVGFNYHYSGTQNVTISGETCQYWANDHSPNEINVLKQNLAKRKTLVNYCREFDEEESEKPWCYTTKSSPRWEYCDIPICKPIEYITPPECVFPFTYEGKTYDSCAPQGWCSMNKNFESQYWLICPIKTEENKDYPYEYTQLAAYQEIYRTLKAKNLKFEMPSQCVIPFIYGGRYHYTCVLEDLDRKIAWCSEKKLWTGRDNYWCAFVPFIANDEKYIEPPDCIFPTKHSNLQSCATEGQCLTKLDYDRHSWLKCPMKNEENRGKTYEQIQIERNKKERNYTYDIPSDCVFPFINGGFYWYTCTSHDSEIDSDWCSTTKLDTKSYRACKRVPDNNLLFNTPEACFIPFKFNEKYYSSCTYIGGLYSWCSVNVYHKTGEFLRCTPAKDETPEQMFLKKNQQNEIEMKKTGNVYVPHPDCVFPFIYDGYYYYNCIPYNEHGAGGAYVCTQNVSLQSEYKKCTIVPLKTLNVKFFVPPECTFPFEYKGKSHTECIKGDESYYWCSINSRYTKNNILRCFEKTERNDQKTYEMIRDEQKEKFEEALLKTSMLYKPHPACQFPFLYAGIAWYNCTNYNSTNANANKYWCSRQSAFNGSHALECKAEVRPPEPTDYFHVAPECVFPFRYEGNDYNECIKGREIFYWCAIDTEFTGHNFLRCIQKTETNKKQSYEMLLKQERINYESQFNNSGVVYFVPRQCVIPFIYAGIKWQDCTNYDLPNTYWCSTKRVFQYSAIACEVGNQLGEYIETTTTTPEVTTKKRRRRGRGRGRYRRRRSF